MPTGYASQTCAQDSRPNCSRSMHCNKQHAAAASSSQQRSRRPVRLDAGVQTLQARMGQLPQPRWPGWLLPRLCAALARGLHPHLLGILGQRQG
jgi:hypothetical protein